MRACLPLTCCVMKAAEKKKTRPASSLLTHSHARCSLPGPLCTLSYSVRQRASLRGLRCGSSWVNPNTNAAAIEPPNRGGTREPNLQRYIEVFPQLSTKAGGWGAQPPLPDAPKPHRSCNLRANQIEEKKGFPRVIPPPAPSHSFVWLLLCGEKKKKKKHSSGLWPALHSVLRWPHHRWLCRVTLGNAGLTGWVAAGCVCRWPCFWQEHALQPPRKKPWRYHPVLQGAMPRMSILRLRWSNYDVWTVPFCSTESGNVHNQSRPY